MIGCWSKIVVRQSLLHEIVFVSVTQRTLSDVPSMVEGGGVKRSPLNPLTGRLNLTAIFHGKIYFFLFSANYAHKARTNFGLTNGTHSSQFVPFGHGRGNDVACGYIGKSYGHLEQKSCELLLLNRYYLLLFFFYVPGYFEFFMFVRCSYCEMRSCAKSRGKIDIQSEDFDPVLQIIACSSVVTSNPIRGATISPVKVFSFFFFLLFILLLLSVRWNQVNQ